MRSHQLIGFLAVAGLAPSLGSCGHSETGSSGSRATHRAAPLTSPSKPWNLFQGVPIVTYTPAMNDDSFPRYGIVFRTKRPLPRNTQNGTRGQPTLNGVGLYPVVTVGKAGRYGRCYEALLDETDGHIATSPALFPFRAAQPTTVTYRLGTTSTRAYREVPQVRSATESEPKQLARRLGCELIRTDGRT